MSQVAMHSIASQYNLAIRRAIRLAQERRRYAYLPSASLLETIGYNEMLIGTYELTEQGVHYRLTVLSQTSMLLGFQDSQYLAGQCVTNDEEFLRFLAEHEFPSS